MPKFLVLAKKSYLKLGILVIRVARVPFYHPDNKVIKWKQSNFDLGPLKGNKIQCGSKFIIL